MVLLVGWGMARREGVSSLYKTILYQANPVPYHIVPSCVTTENVPQPYHIKEQLADAI